MESTATVLERLASVKRTVAEACRRAGRDPESVTLVGITKKFDIRVVEEAVRAGLTDIGENRAQELVEKATVMPGAHRGGVVTWHMVGHLQRNKASLVVEHADVFHALDSVRLAVALQGQLEAAGRTMDCFLQVNVSGEASKFGIDPDELPALGAEVAELDRIRPIGLMTLAAPVDDPEDVRPQFALLRHLSEANRALFASPDPQLSMGMSGDFEVAIEEGATHVRLGTAIFGPRPVD